MSSNIATLPLLGGPRFLRRQRIVAADDLSGPGFEFRSTFSFWRIVRDLLNRSRNAAQRRAKIGNVDQSQEQSCHPEQMYMGEQRQQAEDGHDLELQLLRF